jgi:hypothetical protein
MPQQGQSVSTYFRCRDLLRPNPPRVHRSKMALDWVPSVGTWSNLKWPCTSLASDVLGDRLGTEIASGGSYQREEGCRFIVLAPSWSAAYARASSQRRDAVRWDPVPYSALAVSVVRRDMNIPTLYRQKVARSTVAARGSSAWPFCRVFRDVSVTVPGLYRWVSHG